MKPLRQAIRTTLTAVLPPSRWLVRGSRSARSEPPMFSLTFDDGPHPEHTPQVLDALERWHQKGTFFVIGREAERHPALMQRIVAAGHVLGHHTFTHTEPRTVSSATFLEEIARTDEVLSTWLAQPTPWVRPPKGELTLSKLRGLWRMHRAVALWNVDPRDYRMTSTAQAVAWAKSYRPRHGDIVLLHDRLPTAAHIVNTLGERGMFDEWQSVPLDDWIPANQCGTPSLALRAVNN